MNDLYVKYTGKPLKDIEKEMDRDTFLEADEAKEVGLVDQAFDRRPTMPVAEVPKDVSTYAPSRQSKPIFPCIGQTRPQRYTSLLMIGRTSRMDRVCLKYKILYGTVT